MHPERTTEIGGGQMNDTRSAPKAFFTYLRLAKQKLRVLLNIYPELAALSPRELEVFSHLLSDKTLSTIAEELLLSYSAVHFHCKNIYRKLKLTGRRQLLMTYKELCE